jgi:mannose-1-phosphate guanylyltransferase/phosphomannomutase
MKAMVLAAGLGERLRPLTIDRAKPSLPLLNRPLIEHTLGYLEENGTTEVVINLHHMPESIRGLIGDGRRLGLKVHYSVEPTILGTAGGLKNAEGHFRDSGTFVMINSDFVTDFNLKEAVGAHQASGSLATLILTPAHDPMEYGVVELGEDNRIIRIAGRPEPGNWTSGSRYTFTGIHILEPEILDQIPSGRPFEINREVYPPLIAARRPIRGHVHHGFWRELGTLRLYLEGTLAVLGQSLDRFIVHLQTRPGIYIDQVTLPPDVTIEAPLLVGRACTVGPRSSLLGGVVLGKNVRIGSGCALRSSVLWDGARIGDGASLSDCIVASGVSVPPGATLSGRALIQVEGYQGSKGRLERLGSCWAARF